MIEIGPNLTSTIQIVAVCGVIAIFFWAAFHR